MKRGRARRLAVGLGALTLGPWLALGGFALTKTLPPELLASAAEAPPAARPSVRITDSSGALLIDRRDENGERRRRLSLEEFGALLPRAVIAAEDARFYSHPGVDPVAMGSAVLARLSGKPLTGASTLTQQLARVLEKAPRTRRAKLDVMGLAVRIEMELPKDRILEAYLNEIEFGAKLRGAEAASWALFDKPARELSLAEVAALASIPRGTSLYDPIKHPENLRRRRDRVLDRMAAHGLATADEARAAKGDPLVLAPRLRGVSAPHFAHAVSTGALGTALPPDAVEVQTTLVGELQRELVTSARTTVDTLAERGVTAAAVVVLDNKSGRVLGYVGSPDAYDEKRLGGNDGVRALRQPGSTLKPFVYELAFERLGMTPATLLPDIELSFPTASGDPYRPHNYDERFHGPVLVRQALGNSYNVPAVWVTERLGAENLLDRLHALGFLSLDRPASEYGLALALGDGEVTLLELASAYATLARGGEYLAPTSIAGWQLANGDFVTTATGSPKRVLSEASAALISDILRDKRARAASFGDETVFDLPFDVAAKTGTSKGFRDNFAVGFTSEVTVAVWVGNFDGGAMRGVSGITGAGPLFREAISAASRFFPPRELSPPDADAVEICALSGRRAGPHCARHKREWVPHGSRLAECDMHVEVEIDTLTGMRAGPLCTTGTHRVVFEKFPPLFSSWAESAGRSLAPSVFAARCPAPPGDAGTETSVRVLYPEDGARFFLEAGRSAHVRARVAFPGGGDGATFVIDGVPLAADRFGRATIELVRGQHTLIARAGKSESAAIHFTVE